jgi:SMP-30/gluconolaconase/LRE-like protein
VRLEHVGGIRFRNVHVNAESGLAACDAAGCTTTLRASKFPYENAIVDVTRGVQVREREFAVLDVPAAPAVPATVAATPRPAPGASVAKLAEGFWSISGGAVGPDGRLWFVERRFHRIYGWSAARGLTLERDASVDPVNLAVDAAGHLLVLSADGPEGTVYAFTPGSPETEMTVLAPTPTSARPDVALAIPANYWSNGEFKDRYDATADRFTTLAELFASEAGTAAVRQYVSPDGTLALPAQRTFPQGPGWRWSGVMQTYGFLTAKPGARVFVTNGSEVKTYSGVLGAGGALTDLKVFANRGGESVAVGPDGRVYVANGQVFVYAPDGKAIGRIDVPERPLQLLFGGTDKRTLFILCHHALYSTRP